MPAMPFRNAAFFLLGRGCDPAGFGRLAGGLDALDLPEERLAGALRGDELNAGEWTPASGCWKTGSPGSAPRIPSRRRQTPLRPTL